MASLICGAIYMAERTIMFLDKLWVVFVSVVLQISTTRRRLSLEEYLPSIVHMNHYTQRLLLNYDHGYELCCRYGLITPFSTACENTKDL